MYIGIISTTLPKKESATFFKLPILLLWDIPYPGLVLVKDKIVKTYSPRL